MINSAADIDQLATAMQNGGALEKRELGDPELCTEQGLTIAHILVPNKSSNLVKGQSSGAAQATSLLANNSSDATASATPASSTRDVRRMPFVFSGYYAD